VSDSALILGVPVARMSMDATVARCVSAIESREVVQQVSVNAAKLVAVRHDSRLREIIERSQIVSADGQSVVWASRLLRDPLPGRVAGIDLMHRLLEVAEQRGFLVYVLGAKPDVLATAIARLRQRYPRLEIAGARDGYFREDETEQVRSEIRAARPDVLFVAMSSPKKEYWLDENVAALGVPFSMGVGGAIDVVAGMTRRAPRILQAAGLEWLFRLLQEPRRLAKRYAVTNITFTWLILKAVVAGRAQKRSA
jgi:N-acetylglucosaminyldiphosphoundecaprenol N-acetyl-beta-D-mannosaminyltransferase